MNTPLSTTRHSRYQLAHTIEQQIATAYDDMDCFVDFLLQSPYICEKTKQLAIAEAIDLFLNQPVCSQTISSSQTIRL